MNTPTRWPRLRGPPPPTPGERPAVPCAPAGCKLVAPLAPPARADAARLWTALGR